MWNFDEPDRALFSTALGALIVAMLFAMLFAMPVLAQAPGPTGGTGAPPELAMEIEVRLMYVDVEVFDGKGRPVTGLKKNDLRLLEDGVEQKIEDFTTVSRIIKEEVKADKKGETRKGLRLAEQKPGTHVLLLFDIYNSDNIHVAKARKAAKQFLTTRTGMNDQFAVARFYGSAEYLQDFTDDTSAVARALDKLGPSMSDEPVGADIQGKVWVPSDKKGLPENLQQLLPPESARLKESEYNIMNFVDSLWAIGRSLQGIQGRKTIVFFSPGFEGLGGFAETFLQNVLRDLKDRNIVCHSLDITGATVDAHATPGDRRNFLFIVAHETGGEFVYNISDPLEALVRVYTKINNYYLVGWYSKIPHRDGRSVPLKIEITKDPSYVVKAPIEIRAPKDFEYLTDGERKDEMLRAEAIGATSSPDLPVAMAVAVQPLFPPGRAAVLYQFPTAMEPGSEPRRSYDCLVRVKNASGTPIEEQFTVVRPAPAWAGSVRRVTVVQEVSAVPDAAAIEILVRNNLTDEIGSTRGPWSMEPVDPELFLSPPLLFGTDPTVALHEVNLAQNGTPLFQGVAPGSPPLLDNRVHSSRQATVAFFAAAKRPPVGEAADTIVLGYDLLKDGEPLQVPVKVRTWANPVSGKNAYVCDLPVETLEPGVYSLRLRALARQANVLRERTLSFRVPDAAP